MCVIWAEEELLRDHHLTSQDFDSFATGELPKGKARALIAHLLRGCQTCQAEAAARWRLDDPADLTAEDAYDAACNRAFLVVEREWLLQQVSLAA